MPQVAKIFANGRSQAVRLPAEFRFSGDEVFIRRDEETGDVILSQKEKNFDRFFAALAKMEVPEGFLSPEERDQDDDGISRDPFEGWPE